MVDTSAQGGDGSSIPRGGVKRCSGADPDHYVSGRIQVGVVMVGPGRGNGQAEWGGVQSAIFNFIPLREVAS